MLALSFRRLYVIFSHLGVTASRKPDKWESRPVKSSCCTDTHLKRKAKATLGKTMPNKQHISVTHLFPRASSCTCTVPSARSPPRGGAQRPGPPCSSALQTGSSPPRVPFVQSRWLKLWGQGKLNVRRSSFSIPLCEGNFLCYSVCRSGRVPPSCVGTPVLAVQGYLGSAWCPGTWTGSATRSKPQKSSSCFGAARDNLHLANLRGTSTRRRTRSAWCFRVWKQAAGGMGGFFS